MSKTFEEVQAQVKKLEQDIARAEGGLASIVETLKAKYGCDGLDAAIKKLEELKTAQGLITKKRDVVLAKLMGLKEW